MPATPPIPEQIYITSMLTLLLSNNLMEAKIKMPMLVLKILRMMVGHTLLRVGMIRFLDLRARYLVPHASSIGGSVKRMMAT